MKDEGMPTLPAEEAADRVSRLQTWMQHACIDAVFIFRKRKPIGMSGRKRCLRVRYEWTYDGPIRPGAAAEKQSGIAAVGRSERASVSGPLLAAKFRELRPACSINILPRPLFLAETP